MHEVWKCAKASLFGTVVLADRHSTFAEEKAMTKGKQEKEREGVGAIIVAVQQFTAALLAPFFFRFHGPAEPKPKPNR